MDPDELTRRLSDYQMFADASPPGPDRARFEAIVRDLKTELLKTSRDHRAGADRTVMNTPVDDGHVRTAGQAGRVEV